MVAEAELLIYSKALLKLPLFLALLHLFIYLFIYLKREEKSGVLVFQC